MRKTGLVSRQEADAVGIDEEDDPLIELREKLIHIMN